MTTSPITSRAWMLEQIDEAGERFSMLEAAGATNLEASWLAGDVTVTARKHGDGVTITTKSPGGTEPVPPMKFLAGWLEA